MRWDPTCLVQNYNYPLSSPERWQEVAGSKHGSSWRDHRWALIQSGQSSVLHPPEWLALYSVTHFWREIVAMAATHLLIITCITLITSASQTITEEIRKKKKIKCFQPVMVYSAVFQLSLAEMISRNRSSNFSSAVNCGSLSGLVI